MDRRRLLTFHRWVALVFAPLFALQALTGGALLFRESLARMIDPAPMAQSGTPGNLPVSALLNGATSSAPGFRVTRLFLPETDRDTAFAQMANEKGERLYAAVDPGSGHLLREGGVWRFPLEAALQLHYRLMDGRFGMAVVLANGLALIFLSATGMAYWWPGRARLARSLAIRANAPPRARLRQWHRSTGVVLSLLLLFSATTGILLMVPDLAAADPAPVAPLAPPSAGQIDKAVAMAATAFPEARMRDIRFPTADHIDVNFFAPERNPEAVHIARVSLSEGELLKRLPAAENPVLWMKVLPLHSGESIGLGGRLALFAEAGALLFLAGSGPLMWWQARPHKRKKS